MWNRDGRANPLMDRKVLEVSSLSLFLWQLESRRRRTKGSVVGEEWCQNAAPLRWYTKNVFAQSKMILSRAWLHDTVSCAAWNDARKGVYLKPLFKTPCSNCYWGWSIPIMLDYRDISLMESVPLMWGPVTASPVGIEPMTILEGGPPCYGRLAFIWRIEYIQDLPGAARRLLDSERFEGVPVSSFQERLCTLWQGGKNIWKWVGFCLMKVSCCLLTISSVTESAILGASPRQRFFLAETRKWQLVTLLMPNTKNLCSQNSFGC